MHPNRSFAWTDRREIFDFVSQRAFAHIFTATAEGLHVAHAPLLVTEHGRIQFHLFRSNRARPYIAGNRVMLSVTSRDAYQSANWYEAIDQVPTWLYEAVEIEGEAQMLDEAELIRQVDQLSAVMEARFSPAQPWTRAKMTPGKFESLIKAIVGFEVDPISIRGTRKFNQHKSPQDVEATLAGQRGAGREDIVDAVSSCQRA